MRFFAAFIRSQPKQRDFQCDLPDIPAAQRVRQKQQVVIFIVNILAMTNAN